MFIERTRLQFNGCYIGKTTYIRHGENSFQDQFYRPWHLVAYYRYLRFFPEGVVLVLTSSEEPAQCVSQMKHRNARSPILRGYYRLKDDKVTLVVTRQDNNKHLQFKKTAKRRGADLRDTAEQTFHMVRGLAELIFGRHSYLIVLIINNIYSNIYTQNVHNLLIIKEDFILQRYIYIKVK
jgi:F-box protein 9